MANRCIICPQCGASVDVPPSPSRKAFSRSGGHARAEKLSYERKREIAKAGAAAMWAKRRAAKP